MTIYIPIWFLKLIGFAWLGGVLFICGLFAMAFLADLYYWRKK